MRYSTCRIKQEREADTFRRYTANALMLTAANTAKFAGGSYPKSSYSELISPGAAHEMTAEETIDYIRKKMRGEK